MFFDSIVRGTERIHAHKKEYRQRSAKPGTSVCLVEAIFPMRGALRDPECMHLVRAWSSGKLRRAGLREIFPGIDACSILAVRKPESRTIGWSLDLQELKRILEIGAFDGFIALNLAANLDDGGEVRTIDLPQERPTAVEGISNACESGIVGSKFRDQQEATRIRQLWADSTTADWGEFGSPFDLILIDGCHDYPYVKSDSANAIKHIRPGGTILWHDYGQFADVSRAVDELARDYQIAAIIGTRLACYRSPGTHASPTASVRIGLS